MAGSAYTEFGTADSGAAAPAPYGWLGGKQRSDDALGGLTLLGVRLYNPATGRFLQTDPVPGGSANAYDYSHQDPINKLDLNGDFRHGRPTCRKGARPAGPPPAAAQHRTPQ